MILSQKAKFIPLRIVYNKVHWLTRVFSNLKPKFDYCYMVG